VSLALYSALTPLKFKSGGQRQRWGEGRGEEGFLKAKLMTYKSFLRRYIHNHPIFGQMISFLVNDNFFKSYYKNQF
jgi:hypothetical protein